MWHECLELLKTWTSDDTWIVLSAALAGIACAIPGNYLLLRRQSMMGDALSHTSLLGIVAAFLLSGWIFRSSAGEHQEEQIVQATQWMMFVGAIVVGVLAAVLTEAVQKLGRVEASAALGVVFTTMFASGLLLLRLVDKAHLDVDCVLYGSILDMVPTQGAMGEFLWPRAMVSNGIMVAVNLFLLILFFKELRISTFDAELATALGINSTLVNYVLMAVTASTIVAVFESVGSIIVIAMLIVPAATAFLLCSRLEWMIPISLGIAALSALVGHAAAIVVPPILFTRLGFESVGAASTTGMMAATCGGFFFLALVFSPKQGLVSRWIHHTALSLKVAEDDLLGLLYRMEEWQLEDQTLLAPGLLSQQLGYRKSVAHLALWRLIRKGHVIKENGEYHLTPKGRELAQGLVRAHRLWESYMAHHFNLSDERLHQSAHRIEHYIDPALREDLANELESPKEDPHGRAIPEEKTTD